MPRMTRWLITLILALALPVALLACDPEEPYVPPKTDREAQ